MNSEQRELVARMCGDKPFETVFGEGSNNRTQTTFTWNDMVFNLNSFPFDTDTAIIVTAWAGQLKWLKSTLASYRRSGKYVILSYDIADNHIWDIQREDEQYIATTMPRPVHHLLTHACVYKHKTFDANKRTGWFWDVKYGQGIVNMYPNIKYVYCTNGDCIWEKPEGIDELIKVLGDGDVMSGQSVPGKTIHTADMLFKKEAFNKILDYMTTRMRTPVWQSTAAECLLMDAMNTLKLKETVAPKQPYDKDGNVDFYAAEGQDSTFKEVVGYRNLHAEQEWCENYALEPLPKSYLDNYHNWIYFNCGEQESICKYYETDDRRYLFMWWDRGEDSDYNRLFYPLEYYGKDPIYDTNDRGYF